MEFHNAIKQIFATVFRTSKTKLPGNSFPFPWSIRHEALYTTKQAKEVEIGSVKAEAVKDATSGKDSKVDSSTEKAASKVTSKNKDASKVVEGNTLISTAILNTMPLNLMNNLRKN